MSFRELPVIVLEEIFQYLDLKDMMHAWEAVGKDGGEGYWAKVCKREGYTRVEGFDDGWRDMVTYNINWRANKSVIREYVLDSSNILKKRFSKFLDEESDSDSDSGFVGPLSHVIGDNLFLCYSNELKVFNVTSIPVVVQKLQLVPDYLEVCGSKLLIGVDNSWMVFALEKGQYHKIAQATSEIFSPHALSNEYFASVYDCFSRVRIVNLSSYEEINKILPYRHIDLISLSGVILNIVHNEDSVYILERFNLQEQVYLDSLVLFKDEYELYLEHDMGSNAQLLVHSLYNSMADITSPLSVWRSNGEFLAKLPPDEGPLHIDTFHWLILEEEYLIFSSLPNYLSIWTSKNPTDAPKKLKIEMPEKKETVLNSLLILVYKKGFKVIDYQKVTYLYNVDFGNHLDGSNNFRVFANQYYLVFVQQMETENEEQRKSKSKITFTEEAASTSGDYEAEYEQIKVEVKTAVVIYDFRSCA